MLGGQHVELEHARALHREQPLARGHDGRGLAGAREQQRDLLVGVSVVQEQQHAQRRERRPEHLRLARGRVRDGIPGDAQIPQERAENLIGRQRFLIIPAEIRVKLAVLVTAGHRMRRVQGHGGLAHPARTGDDHDGSSPRRPRPARTRDSR